MSTTSDSGRHPAAESPGSPAAGLYVHIPFCLKKCPYCDFHSGTDLSRRAAFAAALEREMALAAWDGPPFDSLYLGGGTPSVLEGAALAGILDAARERFTVAPDAEVTVEVNPGTVDGAKLNGLRRAGVNRLNIGVQSFDDAHLHFLGRIHSADQAAAAVAAARDAGFDNLGLDLIYGLPGQDAAAWRRDLQAAVALAPEHLSCYLLTYEAGTPLTLARDRGEFTPLDDDGCAHLFAVTQRFLSAHGYGQYEISNFARLDGAGVQRWRSRHNGKYWSGAPYLGLGPGAHSFVDPLRWWNVKPLSAYVAHLAAGRRPEGGRERLSRAQRRTEVLYLGLRTAEGIDLEAFELRFGAGWRAKRAEVLAALEADGCLALADGRLALTARGMRFADGIAAQLV